MSGAMASEAKTVVLTWSALPTTEMMLTAFRASAKLSANSVIHELSSTPDAELAGSLASDGMIVCAGSLAKIAHLLGPNQRAFFDATEDSFLFRTLISPAFPNFRCHKSTTPWSTDECQLDWSGGRKYVVKPNIGYASTDTFVIRDAAEQAALVDQVGSRGPDRAPRDFVIEEYITGLFLCADVVVEGKRVLITSVYERHDYGIKETAQYHSAALFAAHRARFEAFARDVYVTLSSPGPLPATLTVLGWLHEDVHRRRVPSSPEHAYKVAELHGADMPFFHGRCLLCYAGWCGSSPFSPAPA